MASAAAAPRPGMWSTPDTVRRSHSPAIFGLSHGCSGQCFPDKGRRVAPVAVKQSVWKPSIDWNCGRSEFKTSACVAWQVLSHSATSLESLSHSATYGGQARVLGKKPNPVALSDQQFKISKNSDSSRSRTQAANESVMAWKHPKHSVVEASTSAGLAADHKQNNRSGLLEQHLGCTSSTWHNTTTRQETTSYRRQRQQVSQWQRMSGHRNSNSKKTAAATKTAAAEAAEATRRRHMEKGIDTIFQSARCITPAKSSGFTPFRPMFLHSSDMTALIGCWQGHLFQRLCQRHRAENLPRETHEMQQRASNKHPVDDSQFERL